MEKTEADGKHDQLFIPHAAGEPPLPPTLPPPI